MGKRDDRAHDGSVFRARSHLLNETAVDLELVDRKAAQVAHAGVARPKVIDRDQYPHAADSFQNMHRLLSVAHDRGFCQLNLQECWVEPRGIQSAANLTYQVREAELRGRKVDRDTQGARPALLPYAPLATRLIQHPFADGVEQAALVRDGNEVSRQQQAALRMVPANQCFGAVYPSGRRVNLGLVVQLELLPTQCLVQLALELDALLCHR